MRRWEDGKIPLRPDLVQLLADLDARFLADSESLTETILADLDIGVGDDMDTLLDLLAPGNWPLIQVPRVDADAPGPMPASWCRALAARVRADLSGRVRLEWLGS